MPALPPALDNLDDLRRLALEAGTYGLVTIPARALLDLIGAPVPLENPPTRDELRRLILDAERAAQDAESAASELSDAARDLQRVHTMMTPPAQRPRR